MCVHVHVRVCPGTCEVVCGRQEGKLIKPMITLMRSQGVKPEKAFHFLSDSIPLFPTSIYQSFLFLLFFFLNGRVESSHFCHLLAECHTKKKYLFYLKLLNKQLWRSWC